VIAPSEQSSRFHHAIRFLLLLVASAFFVIVASLRISIAATLFRHARRALLTGAPDFTFTAVAAN
jgi:hypothetical protein